MDQSACGCLKVKLGGLDLPLHTVAPFLHFRFSPPLWLLPFSLFLLSTSSLSFPFSLEALKGLLPAATAQMADRRQAVFCNGGFVLCVGLDVLWVKKKSI
ncbi:hypothetical protein QQF64_030417 [Cirrhinus molitorella]|uniref:Uncharacterized protein n=1 Tax=Cirrhinus molitorella TaxID=172907 RepID=A0ABR3N3M6_9TELE